jgi:hypothetical protein
MEVYHSIRQWHLAFFVETKPPGRGAVKKPSSPGRRRMSALEHCDPKES